MNPIQRFAQHLALGQALAKVLGLEQTLQLSKQLQQKQAEDAARASKVLPTTTRSSK